jgi:hypothetical protein
MEGRFDVRLISAEALAGYMKFRGDMSVRELAQLIGNPKARATIGHLRSGKRNTCKPETAHAIEKALNAPPGSLFVATVSIVQRERGRAA